MKDSKTFVCMAALMALFFLAAPYRAHAQEPNPVPWPCRAPDIGGRSIPYPCDNGTEVLVTQSFDAIIANSAAFDGNTGIASLSGGADANRPLSREGRREAFALMESRGARVYPKSAAVRAL